MRNPFMLIRAAAMAAILFVVVTVVALAQEDPITPIIDNLPNEVLLFGASGGAIVTLLISVLKYVEIVRKSGPITPQLANFGLSVLVAAAASVVGGQDVATALLSAFTAMVAASGLHETVGHAAAKVVGNR